MPAFAGMTIPDTRFREDERQTDIQLNHQQDQTP
jgi:hypothetical protein